MAALVSCQVTAAIRATEATLTPSRKAPATGERRRRGTSGPLRATKTKAGKPVSEGIALTVGRGKETRHHPLERPVKRKIAKGRLALEARIDLHGMIQSEAHGFLLGFLIKAHERGLRHVLVITGKGTSLGSDGALKRAVPLWFSLPEFRPLISSYEPAARNHGGEGALYVRLARLPGEKR